MDGERGLEKASMCKQKKKKSYGVYPRTKIGNGIWECLGDMAIAYSSQSAFT